MKSQIPWSVKKATPQKNYTILLEFSDNTKRIYDAKPLLKQKIFTPLQNIQRFMQGKAKFGTVIWNDEIDIAPEHLYYNSKII